MSKRDVPDMNHSCPATLTMLPYYIVKAVVLLMLGRHPIQK